MKRIYLLFTFLFLISLLHAQNIHVNVTDATTGKVIKGAKIKSLYEHDLITFSNDSGYFSFDLTHNDTILIEKDMYYPIFVKLSLHNFDSTHIVTLRLFPSPKKYPITNQYSKMNLQTFDYQFVHDEIGEESKANITILQPKEAVNAQAVWTGTPFKIISIDPFPKLNKGKTHYIMSQPEY
jgi:hypothetical protein